MQQVPLFAMVIVAAAGAGVAFQAPLNAALGRSLDSTVAAATISFFVGFLVLAAVTLMAGDGAAVLRLGQVPKWLLIGGAFGAFFVWSALWAVPVLGVLTTSTLLILGQIVAALVIDHFGAFGIAPRDIGWTRVLAAALVAAGAVLSRF